MDGRDILALGIPQGPHIGKMLKTARVMAAYSSDPRDIAHKVRRMWSQEQHLDKVEGAFRSAAQHGLQPDGAVPFATYLDADPADPDTVRTLVEVCNTMRQALRTPGVRQGAIMPDACPAGPPGTIPVGGIIAAENIHPGMHSADMCCSMYLTAFAPRVTPEMLMERIAVVSHFGSAPRMDRFSLPADLRDRIRANPFTAPYLEAAETDLGTSGDGNHFAFVGRMESTGRATLVTHHGSRSFGARIYKAGMAVAERYRRDLSPETLPQNAWIPYETAEGQYYWEALQIARDWTRENHRVLHEATGLPAETTFWNEHNFVFLRGGLFYHAKGATPVDLRGDSPTIIPMTMAAPILITAPDLLAPPEALGFAPHGAGRNLSRTAFRHRGLGDLEAATAGLDVRFALGRPDATEGPDAYKPPSEILRQISAHNLARVVDRVLPHGSIMAGEVGTPVAGRTPAG